jgi:hypothetical protein
LPFLILIFDSQLLLTGDSLVRVNLIENIVEQTAEKTLKRMLHHLYGNSKKSSPSVATATDVSHKVEKESGNTPKPFVSTDSGTTIMTDLANMNFSHESYLTMECTNIIQELVTFIQPHYHFVNTEVEKWIQDTTNNLTNEKPDGLVAFRGLYQTQLEKGEQRFKTERVLYRRRGVKFIFGSGIWAIRDMYNCIIKWTVQYTPADRGKLYSYLIHLSTDDNLFTYRGILFDQTRFVTAECLNGNIIENSIVEGNFTCVGSREYLTSFISKCNLWLQLLQDACTHHQVQIVDDALFLGNGSYGRCFKVYSPLDNRVYVLKLVLLSHFESQEEYSSIVAMIQAEYQIISDNQNLLEMVQIVPNSLILHRGCSDRYLGASYLMTDVGSPIDVTEENMIRKLIYSLSAFHRKKPPLYHNDSRLANAIMCANDRVVWLDWFFGDVDDYGNPQYARRKDMSLLVLSIIGDNNISKVSNQLAAYCENINLQSLNALVDSVQHVHRSISA